MHLKFAPSRWLRFDLLVTSCLMLCALASSAALAAKPLRIMPVGDSITVGYTDNPTWSIPYEFGYRSGLYTRLKEAKYNFKFVGASAEPFNNRFGDPTRGRTVKPPLNLRTLGQDGHHGYGGIGIGGIQAGINKWIATEKPDVILLMIGANEANTNLLDTLANTIVTKAPKAHLIIAQITPRANFRQSIVKFNSHIRETLVPDLINDGHNVSTVDMYSMFLTDPDDPTSIAAGLHSDPGIKIHPSNAMYDKMAEAWFERIQSIPELKKFANVPSPSALPSGVALIGLVALRRRTNANRNTSPRTRSLR